MHAVYIREEKMQLESVVYVAYCTVRLKLEIPWLLFSEREVTLNPPIRSFETYGRTSIVAEQLQCILLCAMSRILSQFKTTYT